MAISNLIAVALSSRHRIAVHRGRHGTAVSEGGRVFEPRNQPTMRLSRASRYAVVVAGFTALLRLLTAGSAAADINPGTLGGHARHTDANLCGGAISDE